MDSRIARGYFISYPEKSQGFKFYYLNYNRRITETGNAKFIENDKVNGKNKSRNVIIKEVRVDILLVISLLRTTLIIVQQAENIG